MINAVIIFLSAVDPPVTLGKEYQWLNIDTVLFFDHLQVVGHQLSGNYGRLVPQQNGAS